MKFTVTFENNPLVTQSSIEELRACAPEIIDELLASNIGDCVTTGGGAAPYVMIRRIE